MTFTLHEAHAFVQIATSGTIVSRTFADRYLAYYNGLAEPWLHHRLVDFRDSTGYMVYDDVIRLSHFWTPHVCRFPSPRKVAVVNASRLVVARLPTADQLFSGQHHRAFDTVAEAEAWLGGH